MRVATMNHHNSNFLTALLGVFTTGFISLLLDISWVDVYNSLWQIVKVGGMAVLTGILSVGGKKLGDKFFNKKKKDY